LSKINLDYEKNIKTKLSITKKLHTYNPLLFLFPLTRPPKIQKYLKIFGLYNLKWGFALYFFYGKMFFFSTNSNSKIQKNKYSRFYNLNTPYTPYFEAWWESLEYKIWSLRFSDYKIQTSLYILLVPNNHEKYKFGVWIVLTQRLNMFVREIAGLKIILIIITYCLSVVFMFKTIVGKKSFEQQYLFPSKFDCKIMKKERNSHKKYFIWIARLNNIFQFRLYTSNENKIKILKNTQSGNI